MKAKILHRILTLALALLAPATMGQPAPTTEVTTNTLVDQFLSIQDPAASNVVDFPEPGAQSWTEFSRHKEVVSIGRDFHLPEGKTCREAVVVLGNATIDGTVEGSLVVVGGNVKINGKIERELCVVMGKVELGPNAVIENDAIVIGGNLSRAPGAVVNGDERAIPLGPVFEDLHWLTDYVRSGLLLGRPITPEVGWTWKFAWILLGLYAMAALLFPRPVNACVATIESRPIGSFFSGILAFLLMGPVIVLLSVTVVGLLAVPFIACGLVGALILGKAAIYRAIGEQLGRQVRSTFLQVPLVALGIGGCILILLYSVPILGFLVWGALLPLTVGAPVLAAIEGLRSESPRVSSPITLQPSPSPSAPSSPNPPSQPANETGVTSQSQPSLPPPLTVSAENVSCPRAGFWIRFLASLLDLILVGWTTFIIGPFVLLLLLAYFVGFWSWKGTTIGGLVLNLKVVRHNGQPMDFSTALVRSLASIFSLLVLFLGFFWAGWDREKQSWHDKIAGTIVVRVPRGISLV